MNWLTSRCAPLLALTALALVSCDKGTDLNVDLPNTTAISTEYQDFPLASTTGTVRLTPAQTLKADHVLVGRLLDNVAGTTVAGAYFNVVHGGSTTDSLPSLLPTPAPVLDSVVVVMGFDKVYGSATTPVRFDLFKLAAALDERQVYNGSTVSALGPAIGTNYLSSLTRTRQVILKAGVTGDPTSTPPILPVAAVTTTVPDQTVRLLVQRTAVAAAPGQPALSAVVSLFAQGLFSQLNQPNFTQTQLDGLLSGLAVLPSAGHTSSIVSIGQAYDSRLIVYYHSGALRRTYALYFGPVSSRIGGALLRPRYYTRLENPALPPALAALANSPGFVPQGTLGGTSYVQDGTGLGTRLSFAGLDVLKNRPGLTVNRAELRIPVKPFTNALFANPSALYALEVDANNNVLQRTINFAAYDRVVQADGYNQLGLDQMRVATNTSAVGTLIDATTGQAYYSLPISSYLQAYLFDKLEGNPASLVLVPSIRASSALTLNRAAIDAANITLRVYYSK